MKYNCKKVL